MKKGFCLFFLRSALTASSSVNSFHLPLMRKRPQLQFARMISLTSSWMGLQSVQKVPCSISLPHLTQNMVEREGALFKKKVMKELFSILKRYGLWMFLS